MKDSTERQSVSMETLPYNTPSACAWTTAGGTLPVLPPAWGSAWTAPFACGVSTVRQSTWTPCLAHVARYGRMYPVGSE